MAFSTSSTVNGTSRIYSSFSIETGVSASILAFSSTRSGLSEIGLDLKSDLPKHSGDMVG